MSVIGWIFFAICIVGVGISGLWSGILWMDAIDEVNQLLPKERQFPIIFSNLSYFKIRREYQRLYPAGKLVKKSDAMGAIMFGFLLLAIVNAYLFRR